jgi:hypothetical protein
MPLYLSEKARYRGSPKQGIFFTFFGPSTVGRHFIWLQTASYSTKTRKKRYNKKKIDRGPPACRLLSLVVGPKVSIVGVHKSSRGVVINDCCYLGESCRPPFFYLSMFFFFKEAIPLKSARVRGVLVGLLPCSLASISNGGFLRCQFLRPNFLRNPFRILACLNRFFFFFYPN